MLLNEKELKVLGEFSSDYKGKIYGRDISRKLEMNQKTISTILNNLEKKDVVKFSSEGRNKYYYLNIFNHSTKDVLKLIEINRKIIFLKEHSKLRRLFEELDSKSEGILLIFGSYAKGEETKKSDLDIYSMGKIKDVDDLEKSYGIKISVIRSSKKKFDKNLNIVKEVMKTHIVLKGVEEFVSLVW